MRSVDGSNVVTLTRTRTRSPSPPQDRPISPLCVAAFVGLPLAVWLALLAWLWSRL